MMIGNIYSSDKKISCNFDGEYPKLIWTRSRRSFFKLFKRSRAMRLSQVALTALFFSFVSASPLSAIETIKASALKLDLEQNVSSFTKVPPSAKADSYLPLLKQVRLSPESTAFGQHRRPAGEKASMPVTLGFLIGVRVALGPKEVVKPGRRVQIGPELMQRFDTGESYALAVARYRNCKRNAALNNN